MVFGLFFDFPGFLCVYICRSCRRCTDNRSTHWCDPKFQLEQLMEYSFKRSNRWSRGLLWAVNMQSGNKAERLHQQFCVNLSSFKPSFLQLIVAFSIYCLTLRNGGSTKGPSLVHVEMLVAQIYFRLHLRILKRFLKTRRSWLVGGLVLTCEGIAFCEVKSPETF